MLTVATRQAGEYDAGIATKIDGLFIVGDPIKKSSVYRELSSGQHDTESSVWLEISVQL